MQIHKSLAETTSAPASRAPPPPRAPTPIPEERPSHPNRSLFTLADIAAKRRAKTRNINKLTIRTDENRLGAFAESRYSVNMRRSKSSNDVTILGENFRSLNVISDIAGGEKQTDALKILKTGRTRSATISSPLPSKIPKVKQQRAWAPYTPPCSEEDEQDYPPDVASIFDEVDGLSIVDDALFVMLTPPQTPMKKILTLAAHTPSLPKVASPFSPRNDSPAQLQPRAPVRSSPGTGHTIASLHLTKSHWESRYEAWIRSLRSYRRPRSARSMFRPPSIPEEENITRSRFPETPTNPALFPRAGMLTEKALRHVASSDDARSTLEMDWALRFWPMDKIHRTLYLHDMDVRLWFPVPNKSDEKPDIQDAREKDRTLRRWEWDWEMKWRVIEGIAEDENDRVRSESESEYDNVFLVEDEGDDVYGGCEVIDEDEEENAGDKRKGGELEWNENAMEIDAVL